MPERQYGNREPPATRKLFCDRYLLIRFHEDQIYRLTVIARNNVLPVWLENSHARFFFGVLGIDATTVWRTLENLGIKCIWSPPTFATIAVIYSLDSTSNKGRQIYITRNLGQPCPKNISGGAPSGTSWTAVSQTSWLDVRGGRGVGMGLPNG